jgi:beta-lactam-binding protein with PASTA domain
VLLRGQREHPVDALIASRVATPGDRTTNTVLYTDPKAGTAVNAGTSVRLFYQGPAGWVYPPNSSVPGAQPINAAADRREAGPRRHR